jgi:hypothetical protein
MLMPFNGGSGPIGFYVSFLFIAICFLICLFFLIFGAVKTNWRAASLVILVCVGVIYNIVFTEEYLFGAINGNAASVIRHELNFVRNDQSGDQYITYNDIGAFELQTMGKYAGRFYAVPELESIHLATFNAFKGKYLIVDVPRIDPNSGYADFFKHCVVLYKSALGNIIGYIYSCNVHNR